ncbi:hypothetical protein BGZ46_009889 [Entomortierella lignicola]|nr:hypothetical protein BGZ46_009889 [Entomortierella lignicola]
MYSPLAAALSDTSSTDSCPFSLLNHPAVVHFNERLLDQKVTLQLCTVHAFDFDQTLFRSPLPNPALWDTSFIGHMVSWNNCGPGWWHNSATLDMGSEAEASTWDGWWNEDLIVDVTKSANDPKSLTVLITGRCGEVYNDQLLRMVQAKGLDFDLVITKPTTAVWIDPKYTVTGSSKGSRTNNGCYVKIHTFSFKYDFLYSVLLEYPSIQHMQIWDDRKGQIAKFNEAGKVWLDKKLLKTFLVHEVNIPHRFMDPKREIDLVMAMVDIHNKQVDIEAKGGPFMVSGAAPMPPTRPELRDLGIWDPYETYTPSKRTRMEVAPVVQYTGVLFSEGVQLFLKNIAKCEQGYNHWIRQPLALQDQDTSKWDVPDEMHIKLCLGAAQPDFLDSIGGLGATVFVELVAVGELEGKIWALKVQEVDMTTPNDDLVIVAPNGNVHTSFEPFQKSHNSTAISKMEVKEQRGHIVLRKKGTPYITLAFNHVQGARSSMAEKITEWEPIKESKSSKRIILVGTIGEKRLSGLKSKSFGHLAVVPRAEVSIASILKQRASEKDYPLQGRDLGQMIKVIEKEMECLSIANKVVNLEQITALAHSTIEKHFKKE